MKPIPLVLRRIRNAARAIDTVTATGAEVIRLAIPVVKVLIVATRKLKGV